MTTVLDRVLDIVRSSSAAIPREIAPLVEAAQGRRGVQALTDVLEACRLSRVDVVAVHPVGGDPTLSLVDLRTFSGVLAQLFVASSEEGLLRGVRVQTPVPPSTDATRLLNDLEVLDAEARVHISVDWPRLTSRRQGPVASLVKVFVVLAVLEAVASGRFRLDESVVVLPEDLSPLSAGLGDDHVGRAFELAELCRLAVHQSDNTAADVLLRVVGQDHVSDVMRSCGVDEAASRLRSSRQTLLDAWPGAPTGTWDPRASSLADLNDAMRDFFLTTPVHETGHDYFCRLDSVEQALARVAEHPWSPWSAGSLAPPSAVAPARGVLFKGGQGPGVLSAIWLQPKEHGAACLAFAISSPTPFGAIEELYAFSCAHQALAHLGLSGADGQVVA